MNMRSIFIAMCLAFVPTMIGAQTAQVSAALIDDAVLVTSSFTGAKVTVFGSVRGGGQGKTDIVVTVRGPDRPAWIGKRKRTAGLWIGEDRIYFAAAPTFFGVASARPLEQIAPKADQGNRYVDKLVRVWKLDGTSEWLLIHLEIQARKESGFPFRMLIYTRCSSFKRLPDKRD